VLSCHVRDLSPGGIAVILNALEPPVSWCHGVTLLQLVLPANLAEPPAHGCPPLTLDLFGLLRAIETAGPPWLLHFRFLQRLPEVCAQYFAALEGGALSASAQP
jgi:hypothetical protein